MNDFRLKPPTEFCMQTLQYELLQSCFVFSQNVFSVVFGGGNKIINIGD